MFKYAQTNIQLYRQLDDLGWTESQLNAVGHAYAFVTRLFTGQFRPQGKSFISHLIGVASILALHGAEDKTVLAGLLHAAYEAGEFGTGKNGFTQRKKKILAEVVGSEVEEIVRDYAGVHWSTWNRGKVASRLSGLSPTQRKAAFITAANELEECLEYGILYTSPRRIELGFQALEIAQEIAAELSVQTLSQELQNYRNRIPSISIPSKLLTGRGWSYTLHPLSLYQRLRLAIYWKLKNGLTVSR